MRLCVGKNKLDVCFGEEGKSIGIQLGTEPGTFRFLARCSYHFYIKFAPAYTELHNNHATIIVMVFNYLCSLHNLHNTKATGRHVTIWGDLIGVLLS